MSQSLCCFVFLLLLLHFPFSLGYRDGAREESCYDHSIIHVRAGRPGSPIAYCEQPLCNYTLTLTGEVDNETSLELLESDVTDLECDSVYQCKCV